MIDAEWVRRKGREGNEMGGRGKNVHVQLFTTDGDLLPILIDDCLPRGGHSCRSSSISYRLG